MNGIQSDYKSDKLKSKSEKHSDVGSKIAFASVNPVYLGCVRFNLIYNSRRLLSKPFS